MRDPVLNVRVPVQTLDTIKALAALQGRTVSAVAREALNAAFDGIREDVHLQLQLQQRIAQLQPAQQAETI